MLLDYGQLVGRGVQPTHGPSVYFEVLSRAQQRILAISRSPGTLIDQLDVYLTTLTRVWAQQGNQ